VRPILYVEIQESGSVASLGVTLASQLVSFYLHCIKTIICVVVVALLVCARAFGIDTDRSIKQLYHSAWTAKDGAPTQATGITRTSDGYVWIASHLGLFRFNGLRFEPYQPPPGVSLPSSDILNVLGTENGMLWVSFNPSGAAYITKDHAEVYDQPGLELHSFVEDKDGRVWATTLASLRYFDGTAWKEFHDPELAGKRLWTLFCDRAGGLWVATDKGVDFLPRNGRSFQQVVRHSNVRQVKQDQSGEMWMVDWYGLIRPVLSVPPRCCSRARKLQTPHADFFFDRDGSLWIATDENGVGRLRHPFDFKKQARGPTSRGIEWFSSRDGLTHDWVAASMEDTEGNIWIATFRGLDRFRHSTFAPISTGRTAKEFTLQAAEDGVVWIGSSTASPILLVRGEKVLFAGPNTRVVSVSRDSKGIIWWGGYGGIWRQNGRRFSFFPQPKKLPPDWIWEVAPDDETGGLWVGMGDSGLMRFKNGIWSDTRGLAGLPSVTPDASFHENEQRIWFGYRGNQVAELSAGKAKLYTAADGLNVGRIRTIRGTKGPIWFGGETGLQVLKDGQFTTVRSAGPEPIGKVTGIVEASDGSLWLNELHGVVRISPAGIEQLLKDPNQPVPVRRFDSLDGLPGATQIEYRSSNMLESSDRRIWVATDGGVAWADPSKEQVDTFEPPVLITGVHANARDYLQKEVELPAGTRSVRFTYEALSLSIPERVQFRYILSGVDDDWHEADTKRDASYSNLSPGHYQFTVAATNGGGVWNPMNASVQLTILPLFYQTLWFRTLAVLVFIMLVWMLFLVRLRQSNERIEARLGERLLERDRIARELHDTLLQGFQMLVLRFQVIADTISPESSTRSLLEESLSRAERTLQEGRDKVSNLRSGAEPLNDLAVELAQFGRELSAEGATSFRFTVEGNSRPIQPIVGEEIRMIAREAIANSFRHAAATSVECVIQFAHRHFLFVCKDNGCGIPENVLETKNKDGHWGLVNMAERARKIGAVLHITRDGTGGTEVRLKLRAGVAYATNSCSKLVSLLKHRRE